MFILEPDPHEELSRRKHNHQCWDVEKPGKLKPRCTHLQVGLVTQGRWAGVALPSGQQAS